MAKSALALGLGDPFNKTKIRSNGFNQFSAKKIVRIKFKINIKLSQNRINSFNFRSMCNQANYKV